MRLFNFFLSVLLDDKVMSYIIGYVSLESIIFYMCVYSLSLVSFCNVNVINIIGNSSRLCVFD